MIVDTVEFIASQTVFVCICILVVIELITLFGVSFMFFQARKDSLLIKVTTIFSMWIAAMTTFAVVAACIIVIGGLQHG